MRRWMRTNPWTTAYLPCSSAHHPTRKEAVMSDTTPAAPKPDPDRAKASQGAQVILDPKSDAALGAKGGAFASIEDNTNFRNAGLIAANLDPLGPSAQLTDLPPDAKPPEVPVVTSTTGADTTTGGGGTGV